MANQGTLHGRNSRMYLGVTNAGPVRKVNNANGTAISTWNVNTGVDFLEDTAQGDVTKTYVPGLPDYGGDFTLFYQDVDTAHPQFELIDAAMKGTVVKHYAYPGLGAGVTNVYFYGLVYLSMTGLPAGVDALVSTAFEMRPAGPITFVHP